MTLISYDNTYKKAKSFESQTNSVHLVYLVYLAYSVHLVYLSRQDKNSMKSLLTHFSSVTFSCSFKQN